MSNYYKILHQKFIWYEDSTGSHWVAYTKATNKTSVTIVELFVISTDSEKARTTPISSQGSAHLVMYIVIRCHIVANITFGGLFIFKKAPPVQVDQ